MPHPNVTLTIPERILDKVEVAPNGCLIFTGYRSTSGYGQIMLSRNRPRPAHRLLYEVFVGPVPQHLTLDHLCRNRACVNPAHLEPVSHRDNILRGEGVAAVNAAKTHCNRGHAFTAKNTRLSGRRRICRTCARDWTREKRRSLLARPP